MPPLGPPKPTPRQRVLAQWRGVDTAPQEAVRSNSAKKPGEVMPKLLKSLRLEQRRAELEIVRVWNQLIDPVITAHAQPTGLARGTLFVTVDNSVWLDEIVRYRRKEILDRLQHSFGRAQIMRISFRVG
jgi:predicted nucleic acid-binding Zn ribbon protein